MSIANPDQVNLHRVNPHWLISCARWLQKPVAVCQTTICKRCTEEQNRLFEGFNNYRQPKDLFYYILYSSYCLLHLQNNEKRFQNCALRYNFLHAALGCSSFRFETVIFLRLYVRSWFVQFCMLLILKDSVFVLCINELKCSLKTSVSVVLATEHLKL